MKKSFAFLIMFALSAASAQAAGEALQKDKPIQISSDKLDVFQNEHKAIFSGNVIAVQGTTTMRSAEMIVFYRDSAAPAKPGVKDKKTAVEAIEPTEEDAPAADPSSVADGASVKPPTQGIYRIDATGKVVFTTPTETAIGDKGVYLVDNETIDLTGKSVTLTRGDNILKGNRVVYNMATNRSVLTGTPGKTADGEVKPARVHGLFVPKSDKSDAPDASDKEKAASK